MVQIIFSPAWFYGKDIAIDAISLFVVALISVFSFKYYKIRKNKNYIYFGLAFALLSISFLFKILTNFTIYYSVWETKYIGLFTLTYQTVKESNTLFFVGFLLYRLLTLLGLYMLYSTYIEQTKANMFIVAYLILVSTYFSESSYYVFHTTALIFLILITINYSKTYRKNRIPATKLLASSFAIIALSQIFFIFVTLGTRYYVIAEIIQLIGYTLLLAAFLMVLRHGKEKNKD